MNGELECGCIVLGGYKLTSKDCEKCVAEIKNAMGCVHSKKREVLRTNSGKLYNREVHTHHKFRSGLHVEKTSEMEAEANFQAGFATDVTEKYTRANGNHIPKVSELVSRETQTAPMLSFKKNNNEKVIQSDQHV